MSSQPAGGALCRCKASCKVYPRKWPCQHLMHLVMVWPCMTEHMLHRCCYLDRGGLP